MASNHKPYSRTTINDVSRLAQVSTATVSRVLNRSAFVAGDTTARVMAAIEELNYFPNSSARVLAGGRTCTLGLIIPEVGARSLLHLLAGIEAGADEYGYHLLLYSTGRRMINTDELLQALGPHNCDGLLVYVSSLDGKGLKRLYTIGFPLVLLHQVPPKGLSIPYVTFQNKQAVKGLIDHLIEVHGYRRIAFLQGPEGHDDSIQREIGYRESLKSHGIPRDPTIIGFGGFNPKDAQKTVAVWLANGVKFEAIFTGADEAALGAIQSLRDAGLRIPQDVAVVGFDDIDLGYNFSPPLTTIRADFVEAGFQATVSLAKLISKIPTKQRILLPTQMVIRKSCGCNDDD